MGQEEVLNILERDKKQWYTINMLKDKLPNISRGSVLNSVKRLAKHKIVESKIHSVKEAFQNSNRARIYVKHKEEVKEE